MHPELEALLVVQDDDEQIREIERQKESLAPRLASLDQAHRRAMEEATRAETVLAREEERHRALESRVVDYRARHEKNLAVLDQAQRLKEATAAQAQVDAARRVLADEESELLALGRRITDLRSAAAAAREAVGALEAEQVEARQQIAAEAAAIDDRIREATERRNESARSVPPAILSRYERIYRRHQSPVIFALRNYSCGNCDTAIPLQRRPALQSGQQIETCEACGVLLYLERKQPAEAPTAGVTA